jgi:hypothetical protein
VKALSAYALINLQNNHQTDDLQVIACTARYQPYQNQLLKTVQLPVAPDIIHQALNQQQSVRKKCDGFVFQ